MTHQWARDRSENSSRPLVLIAAGVFIALIVAGILIFTRIYIPANSDQAREHALEAMNPEERTFVEDVLGKLTRESTYNDVIRLLGKPLHESTIYYAHYVYDCPKPSPVCAVTVDLLKGKVYQIDITRKGSFSYVLRMKDKPTSLSEFDVDDPQVKLNMKKAKEQLATIIERVQNKSCFKHVDCSIKYDFSLNERHEHMWVDVFSFKDGMFYGELVSNPEVLITMKWGDRVRIPKEDVEDWVLYDQERDELTGGFTITGTNRENDLKSFKDPKNIHEYVLLQSDIIHSFKDIKTKKTYDLSEPQPWDYGFIDTDKAKMEGLLTYLQTKGLKKVSLYDNKELKGWVLVVTETRIHTADTLTDRLSDLIIYTVEHDTGRYLGWHLEE